MSSFAYSGENFLDGFLRPRPIWEGLHQEWEGWGYYLKFTVFSFLSDMGQQCLLWLLPGSSENDRRHQQQNCGPITSTDGQAAAAQRKDAWRRYIGNWLLSRPHSGVVKTSLLCSEDIPTEVSAGRCATDILFSMHAPEIMWVLLFNTQSWSVLTAYMPKSAEKKLVKSSTNTTV